MRLKEARVAVVGLGLMGGSLAGALTQRGLCAQVTGVARRAEVCRRAEALGFVHEGTMDLESAVRSGDLVVLATPVRTVLELLPQVGNVARPGAVILDLGSTKRQICQAMEDLPAGLDPVGGHPMCGRERSGLEAATPDLYEGAPFVLTPLPRTSGEALGLAEELATGIGARPLCLSPDRHDRLVGAASHLPYLLAVALVRLAARVGQADAGVWELAASGFRDTSRLAASDVTMMLDILLTNREPILPLLREAQKELGRLSTLLEQGDEEGLRRALTAARTARKEWQP
ncbi:MAG: prephenate dehydrogenase [Anaerolineae bacterium]